MVAPPPWLERLLTTGFFHVCGDHLNSSRNECNMFCLDCDADSFCFYCRSASHKDHRVIQVSDSVQRFTSHQTSVLLLLLLLLLLLKIRRSSYHDVVRVSEIQKVLDISGVQTYVINSARVLFLNERPQPKGSKATPSSSHVCEICRRTLLDTFCFCSLGCKFAGIKANADTSSGPEFSQRPKSKAQQDEEGSASSSSRSTARRRKGVPRRAPPFGP